MIIVPISQNNITPLSSKFQSNEHEQNYSLYHNIDLYDHNQRMFISPKTQLSTRNRACTVKSQKQS